jgi:hypothetical protein
MKNRLLEIEAIWREDAKTGEGAVTEVVFRRERSIRRYKLTPSSLVRLMNIVPRADVSLWLTHEDEL